MKRILVFIGLKIAEISAIVFIPWGLGLWNPIGLPDDAPAWVMGLGTILIGLVVPVLLLCLCYVLISVNWEWAKKILDRK